LVTEKWRFPRDELWRAVEDPTADPSTRAGAAIALRGALSEGESTRLRAAAEACAAPKLRVALDKIASRAAEDALVEALDALADAARTSRGER
jgi:hypothetical protein